MSRTKRSIAWLTVILVPVVSCRYVVGLEEGHFPGDASADGEDAADTIDPDEDAAEENDVPGDPGRDDSHADPGVDPEEEESTPVCGTCPDGWACDESSGACVPEQCARGITVPAGELLMGTDETSDPPYMRPEHLVNVSPFTIDACEVTNAQYRTCVAAGVCTAPADPDSNTRSLYYEREEFNGYPVLNVTWEDAALYCEWAGKRLSTEAEWEKAARGGCELGTEPDTCDEGDRRIYPWGNDLPDCTKAHYDDCSPGDTVECGSFADGASPYGVLDMAGNVMEWVSDWYSSNYYNGPGPWLDPEGPESGYYKTMRGGSYQSNEEDLRVFERFHSTPGSSREYIGFRCVRKD